MSQTQIILIVAALLVIAIFFWRSKREERKIRDKDRGLGRSKVDVLMDGVEKQDPLLDEQKMRDSAGQPSDTPPVYVEIEKESAAQVTQESLFEMMGHPKAPVDPGVQWVLELVPQEGHAFFFGGIQSLWLALTELQLPLQINLWAKSRRDNLYYSPKHLPIEASHLVVAVVVANRVAMLDPVSASKVLQVLEQAAMHNDVDVRTATDVEKVPQRADDTRRFIDYFDSSVNLLIVPMSEDIQLTAERVGLVAKAAGFKPNAGRWDYRLDPMAREPAFTLSMVGDGTLKLTLDVPMSNLGRGDLQRFFSLANHLANHLGAGWFNEKREVVDSLLAISMEKALKARMKMMHDHGVDAGSERAARIFARGA